MLDDLPGMDLRVFVVWEPVVLTDLAPPTTGVLSRISDSRAIQVWDVSRLLSDVLVKTALRGEIGEDSIVWDYVIVFPPGDRWDESLPHQSFAGGPVVRVTDELRSRLSALAGPDAGRPLAPGARPP